MEVAWKALTKKEEGNTGVCSIEQFFLQFVRNLILNSGIEVISKPAGCGVLAF